MLKDFVPSALCVIVLLAVMIVLVVFAAIPTVPVPEYVVPSITILAFLEMVEDKLTPAAFCHFKVAVIVDVLLATFCVADHSRITL